MLAPKPEREGFFYMFVSVVPPVEGAAQRQAIMGRNAGGNCRGSKAPDKDGMSAKSALVLPEKQPVRAD
jgi:hypothetical protein